MRETMTLATEMLHEIKRASRRWFIAFIVMCVLEVCTILFFIWYISLPTNVSETTTVEQHSDNESTNNYIGGDSNVSEAEGD